MPSFLMPLLEGVAAGGVVAFVFFFLYSRTQRKSATRTLTAARSEAEQLVADASRKGAEARAAIVLEGKMETLRLREDLEKEFQKRREEWERFERRAEDREAAVERKLEELQRQERGLAGRGGGNHPAGGWPPAE
jgi:Domain of unknown function (DUF3552).